MTPAQIKAALALNACSFLPGSWDKRFARDMAAIAQTTPDKKLSDKQLLAFEKLLKKYRKQLGGMEHFRRVHGEKLLEQFDALFGAKPEPGSVVLGGTMPQPRPFDAVLGGDRGCIQ